MEGSDAVESSRGRSDFGEDGVRAERRETYPVDPSHEELERNQGPVPFGLRSKSNWNYWLYLYELD